MRIQDLTPSISRDTFIRFAALPVKHLVQGFFYNRYKPPSSHEKLGTETDTNVDQQLWYHVVGTSQKEDKFVYAEPEHPTWFIGAEITDDGR